MTSSHDFSSSKPSASHMQKKVLNGSFPMVVLYALSFDINFHVRTGSYLVWRNLMTSCVALVSHELLLSRDLMVCVH